MEKPSENSAGESPDENAKDDPSAEVAIQEPADLLTEEGEQPELEEKKKRGLRITILDLIVIFGITGVLAAVLVPNFIRARSRGALTACKSNLKNMGTAMEMYSTDNSGKYPVGNPKFALTPNYLKTIPECPSAGTDTYYFTLGAKAPYNTQGYQDYYFIECVGEFHKPVSVPANYPQYNGIVGLIER